MCPIVNYVPVILCNIVMMENNWKLASSWCKIGYLRNLCLSSLISLRNSSVLGINIWISIFKWIGNENSKLSATENTAAFANPPFLWDTLNIWKLSNSHDACGANVFLKVSHLAIRQAVAGGARKVLHLPQEHLRFPHTEIGIGAKSSFKDYF